MAKSTNNTKNYWYNEALKVDSTQLKLFGYFCNSSHFHISLAYNNEAEMDLAPLWLSTTVWIKIYGLNGTER